VDRLLIRPTNGARAGAGSKNGQVPLRAPSRANQYLGHVLATNTSIDFRLAEPADTTLTVSIQPLLTPGQDVGESADA